VIQPSSRLRLAAWLVAAALAACNAPARDQAPAEAAESAEATSRAEPATRPPAPAPRRERRPSPPPSAATAYRYIDETGRVQVASSIGDVPERQRDTAVPIAGAGSATVALREPRGIAEATRPANSVDVTIYTTRSCPYCRAAIKYFEQHGIDYVNRDVQEDEDARADYLEVTNNHPGVPVIVVGNDWIQGWSSESFEHLLKTAQ
jgi:glutaredoxin